MSKTPGDGSRTPDIALLLLRAANAIEEVAGYVSGDRDVYRHIRLKEQNLIRELRDAATKEFILAPLRERKRQGDS